MTSLLWFRPSDLYKVHGLFRLSETARKTVLHRLNLRGSLSVPANMDAGGSCAEVAGIPVPGVGKPRRHVLANCD